MRDDLELYSVEVVDLMTTWGATARPGVGDLLDVLSEFGRADVRTAIRAVLESPGITLPDELQRETTELLASVGDDSSAAEDPRLTALVPRLEAAARKSVVSQQEALRNELETWSPLLEAGELDRVFDSVWSHDADDDLLDYASGVKDLEQARGVLGKARWRVDDEMRKLLESPQGVALGQQAADRIRATLDAGDPRRICAARREMRAAGGGAQDPAVIESASSRLAGLRDRARALLDAPGGFDGCARGLLQIAVAKSDAVLAQPTTSGEAALQRRVLWEQSLTGLLDSLTAEQERSAARRKTLQASLAAELRAEALAEVEKNLTATGTDDPAFDATFAAASAALSKARSKKRGRVESAATKLREHRDKLEKELLRLAANLPTESVVEARVLLEQASDALAGDDPSRIESLTDEIRKTTQQLGDLSEQGQRQERGRAVSQKKRLLAQADRLEQIAEGAMLKKVRSLAQRIEDTSSKDLEGLSGELNALTGRAGNAIRLEAADVLDRLGRRGDDDDEVAELRRAFDADDLPAMAELGPSLRKAAGRSKLPLLVYAGSGALILAAVVWQWSNVGRVESYPYQLQVVDSGVACNELALVRDGDVHERFPSCGAGRSVSTELESGTYEIFVNQRYTGRTVRVPDDSGQISDIPVPSPRADR